MIPIETVPLDVPIKRGEQKFAELHLRRPGSGELRGCSLGKLAQFDVDELLKLLPRIATITGESGPSPITAVEAAAIDPADLMEVADKVSDFLLSKRRKASLLTT
jgi:hypothetical protein